MNRKHKSIALLIGNYHKNTSIEFDLMDFNDEKQIVLVHFHGDDYIINGEAKPIIRELTWNYFRMIMSGKMKPAWFAALKKE